MRYIEKLLWTMAASACLLAAQSDPPGRVARLSYTYGPVSFRAAGVDEWVPADVNRPLTTGDHLFVEFAGTGELQIGCGVLRMNSATSIEFLNLDDSNVQLRLTEGTLVIRLRYLGDQDSFEVDTPNLAFSLLRPGVYRIDVKPATSTTTVTVRGGEGELTDSAQAFTVHAGEQGRVVGTDQPNYDTAGAPPFDQFDSWSAERDMRDDQSPSARYVSRDLIGFQDLDKYGAWRDAPGVGSVWVPNGTPSGWAPYHVGHWVWMDPWGWTWVDELPWGFAPFHYGRWAYVGNYWGWVPGPIAERPVYAPALVAWVGGAGGGGFGGGVAWFPLGPREVYVPTYHTSPVYLTRMNVSNTVIVNNVNITNINVTNVTYVNRSAPGAVMAVRQDAFASAKPVQSAAITVTPEALKSAPVIAAVAVAPTRASIAPTAKPGAKIPTPPAALLASPVIAKKAPPPPPIPFAQKQAALASNGGRPLDATKIQQLRQAQPPPARPLVKQVQARPVQAAPPAATPRTPAAQPGRPAAPAPVQAPAPTAPKSTPAAAVPPRPAEAAPAPQAPRPAAAPAKPEAAPPAKPAAVPPPAKPAAKDDKKGKDKKEKEKKDEDKKD